MTKKYWAYLLIAFGAAMVYSYSQLTKGIDASTTTGRLESDLADLSVKFGSGDTPILAYGLIGFGAWMLFG
jgi:hypothetical protein